MAFAAPAPVAAPSAPPPTPETWVRDAGAARRDRLNARRWTVDGSSKVTGDVEVSIGEFRGAVSVGGRLAAGSFSSSGSLEALGPVEVTESVTLAGSTRFSKAFSAGSLNSAGALVVGGPVSIRGVAHVQGALRCRGEARFGSLVGKGELSVGGTLTAEKVHFEVVRDSVLQEVAVGSLTITRPAAPPFRIPGLMPDRPTLRALRIDAQEVALEGVDVELLKAERITLGPDCHVARLIGTLVAKDPKAHVGPESRTPPPHGIWR